MGARSVIQFTTGTPGSGKTWLRGAYWVVNEFLRDGTGKHISNFPIRLDEMAAFASRRLGVSEGEVRERVVLISESTLEAWRSGRSGPWETFAGVDLSGSHIAIDEAHHYIGSKLRRSQVDQWQKWLGEIRHRGATVEFLTQARRKCHKDIWDEAVMWLALVNSEEERDPLCRIQMRDWYELRAKIVGEYNASVWAFERRQADGRWVQTDKKAFPLDSDYFELYDSFSAPQAGGMSGKPLEREFRRRSWPGLLWWFFRRNWWRLGRTAGLVGFVLWIAVGGGGSVVFSQFAKGMPGWKPPASAQGVVNRAPVRAGARSGAAVAPVGEAVLRQRYESQISALNESLKSLRDRYMEQSARLAELEQAERERAEVAVLVPEGAWLSSGELVHVGKPVPSGELQGEVVKEVDLVGRKVVFASGRVVRPGRRVQSGAAGSSAGGAAPLRGDVSGASAVDGEAAGVESGDPYSLQPGGGGPAPKRIRSNTGFADGGQRGGVGAGGGSPRDGRPAGSDGGLDFWDRGSAMWRAGDEDGEPVFSGDASAGGSGRSGSAR